MALVKNNLITAGLSGSIGGQIVFRRRGEETVVSKTPVRSDKPFTAAQLAQQQRFERAVIYSKAAIADPATKAAYKAEARSGQSAFNVAFADFLNAPRIDEIDLTGYTGAVGSTIRIRCVDDFVVDSVYVKIENQDGSVADEGDAVLDANGLDWIFTAIKVNADLAGDKITVTAVDKPGNKTAKTEAVA